MQQFASVPGLGAVGGLGLLSKPLLERGLTYAAPYFGEALIQGGFLP